MAARRALSLVSGTVMADDDDRGIRTNSPMDALVARLIERTDELMRQAADARRFAETSTAMLSKVNETLVRLDVTVANLSDAIKDFHDMDRRLRDCETKVVPLDKIITRLEAVESRSSATDDNTSFRKAIQKWALLGMLGSLVASSATSYAVHAVLSPTHSCTVSNPCKGEMP